MRLLKAEWSYFLYIKRQTKKCGKYKFKTSRLCQNKVKFMMQARLKVTYSTALWNKKEKLLPWS